MPLGCSTLHPTPDASPSAQVPKPRPASAAHPRVAALPDGSSPAVPECFACHLGVQAACTMHHAPWRGPPTNQQPVRTPPPKPPSLCLCCVRLDWTHPSLARPPACAAPAADLCCCPALLSATPWTLVP
ncbi:hypothetical protein P171DRAFT_91286 [Karstenula rhodostoma CBS 690.94]|uniref:Uncharacterized protein n=1 Tax=Karstenula rhodostoma CBS 690.94 TaxID=1392251 RepID=A0A9P4PBZ0_9PLEO|nr:hypothetical protein P171DRAFT_91286 [Karstenula rhodostoma CBS 690.94]